MHLLAAAVLQLHALLCLPHQRLQENVALLLQVWISEQADRYFTLPAEERAAFLDREIANLDRLRQQVTALMGDHKTDLGDLSADYLVWGTLLQRTNDWIGQAEPEQQSRLREFQQAVQNRLLARQLERTIMGFE